ncbi:MAG: ANTAR domain-containing protein [Deltaproteobacteria bacterium]|nr:ANTAR domain-containing protein [Deltaproteobacteria bacterium]
MERLSVVLLQKHDSPLESLLSEVLDRELRAVVFRQQTAPLPEVAGPNPLVILDCHGYEPSELAEMEPALAAPEVGVVLVCPGPSSEERSLALRLGALAFVPQPNSAQALAVVLELAAERHFYIGQLREARAQETRKLEDRPVIERAKYLLMTAKGVSEEEAMQRMRAYARNHNLKLVEVAQNLIRAHDSLGDGD